MSDERPVDPQLAGEASDLRARFHALCDGGGASDPGLLALELDNLAIAVAHGTRGLASAVEGVLGAEAGRRRDESE